MQGKEPVRSWKLNESHPRRRQAQPHYRILVSFDDNARFACEVFRRAGDQRHGRR